VVTRAASSLAVSRLLSGAGGDDLGASVFWEELRDFYRPPVEDGQSGPLECDRVLTLGESGLVAHAASSLRAGLRESAVLTGQSQQAHCEARVRAAAARARHAARTQSEALGEFAQTDTFSPSALEMYARCPYLWFVTRAVGADSLEFEAGALLAGSIAHKALDYHHARHPDLSGAEDAQLADSARAAVDQALEQESVPHRERAALATDVTPKVLRSLRADQRFLPGWETAWTEWSFGTGDGLTVSFGDYRLRGRVDRIDMRGQQAVVIDYKLGRASGFAAAKLRESKTIQAPLYAHAVRSALDLDIVAALYRGLADGSSRGIVNSEAVLGPGLTRTDLLSAAEFDDFIEWAQEEAIAAAQGIRAGRLDRTGGNHCRYCPVAGWCEVSA
jgi:ATP-dependent helicase/DNAse subunit B